jgi:hypothetical protein
VIDTTFDEPAADALRELLRDYGNKIYSGLRYDVDFLVVQENPPPTAKSLAREAALMGVPVIKRSELLAYYGKERG